MPALGRKWTPEDAATALRMNGEGIKREDIGAAIGRTARQVTAKLEAMECKARRNNKRAERRCQSSALAPPEASLLERDHAYAKDRDYMAELMGDPRPGRSALDRSKA